MNPVSVRLAVALLILAPSLARASGTVVRSVRVAPGAAGTAIVIEADGPLPQPTVGVLKGPPRIYLDLQGVTPATTGIFVEGNALVREVRVGLHQNEPPVTRVVIELARAAPYRIEAGGRGQLTVVVGAPGAAQPGTAPALPPAGAVSAAPKPSASATALRSVRVVPGAGTVAIVVEADGPLPLPTVGVLKGPPRIYLDFRGVAAAKTGIPVEGYALVRQVRVAPNHVDPPVARVVIELVRAVPYRIEADGRERGQLTVVVVALGAKPPAPPIAPAKAAKLQSPAQAAPPNVPREAATPPPPAALPAAPSPAAKSVTTAPPPPAPGAGSATPKPPDARPRPAVPATPATISPKPASEAPRPARVAPLPPSGPASAAATAQVPAQDLERYLRRISAALDRLERLRPVLVSLDALAPLSEARLKTAADEFDSIRQDLTAAEPPGKLKATHEVFSTVCVLGALSARTRLEAAARGDTAGAWNAASAAASAIMLLDRARADLGLTPRREQE